MFTKLHKAINQGKCPLNLGQRKWLTWHPFLHTLTSKTVSHAFVIIYKRIKLEKGKKQDCLWKKKHNFLMKRIIRICRHGFVGEHSDNILSEFQPIWSRGCRPGTRNARTTHLFFYFWETEKKLKFGGIQVLWDYHTKGDTAQESTFCTTIWLW